MNLNYNIDTYNYFLRLNSAIHTGYLLDYGSNYGMFLASSNGSFDQRLYTGVDVDQVAMARGRELFPSATFIHSNAYNVMYNPGGQIDSRPVLPRKYQSIISYSVFTHTTVEDMVASIAWLYDQLTDNGTMCLTFCTSNNRMAIEFASRKYRYKVGQAIDSTKDVCYLTDGGFIETPGPGRLYTFYRTDFLVELFRHYDTTIFCAESNENGCFNDCIIIKKH